MTTASASTSVTAAPDGRALRSSLAAFATGVAIATARTGDGELTGVTINSFASVSLDPPLVVWSLAASAASLPVFTRARFHAINVLAADQLPLAQRFATRGVDRFAGVARHDGACGAVLIDGALAHFVCRARDLRETGDHTLIVSEVVDYRARIGEPLIFHAGRYWTRGAQVESAAPLAVLAPLPRSIASPS